MDISQLVLTWVGWPNREKLALTWCKFDLDQSERNSSEDNASARKAWPNGVASRSKFSTCDNVLAEQFRRLRVGDWFWFENEPKASLHTTKTAFTACQLEEIRKTSLAKVICNNSDYIAAIPKQVLSLLKGFVSCDKLPDVNLEVWKSNFVCKPN